MKMYHISELEQLSGIKAPTLRVWERRYKFIQPGRTDTNIRMYDDDQVRKLLNIVTLLSNGYKLSKIAQLDDDDIHAMVLGLHGVANDPDAVSIAFINDLILAMLSFDETAFEQSYTAAVKRYGMFEAMLKVFYPLLERVGIMWSTADVMPVQEHFASSIVRRKLISAADALVIRKKRRKKFLLMLPPGEWHEIGLLFANYIIRSKDIETIYLGQNVPYEQVAAVYEKANCSHVLLFFITRPAQDNLESIRKQMGITAEVPLLYTGSSVVTQSLVSNKSSHLLQSPHDLLKYLG
ncbi:MAG: MerR family transcriptional regulator [Chitinophagaceae bacterium]|nr:MAG: MerR family transcriptional regulator [Chitinophagaceae bacterium]